MTKHYLELVSDTKVYPEGSISNLARAAAKLLALNFTVEIFDDTYTFHFSDISLNDKEDRLLLRIRGASDTPRWIDITNDSDTRAQILKQYEEHIAATIRARQEDHAETAEIYTHKWATPNEG